MEHLLGAGLAIGLGMCSKEASREQELSPWQSWLTDRDMGCPGRGEPCVPEVHRQGLGDPAGPAGRSTLSGDTFGEEGSVPQSGRWVSSVAGQELILLKGKGGSWTRIPLSPQLPMEKLRLRCSARGRTTRWARTQASRPSSGLCQALRT